MQSVTLNDPHGVFFARLGLDAECHPTMPDEIAFGCCADTMMVCQNATEPLLLTWTSTGTPTSLTLSWSGDQSSQQVIATGVDPTTGHYTWHLPADALSEEILQVVIESASGVSDTLFISLQPPPTVGLAASADTACVGDTIVLTTQPDLAFYSWQDSIVGGATYNATTSGLYSVNVGSAIGCIASEQVELTFLPSDAWPGTDTLVCDNAQTILHSATGFDQYLWSTGSTVDSSSVEGPGMITVQAWSAVGCVLQDTIQVLYAVAPELAILTPDTACIGLYLHVSTNGTLDLQWNTGAQVDSTLLLPGANLYMVQGVDMYGCMGADSVLIVGIECGVGIGEHNAARAIWTTSSTNGEVVHIVWNAPLDRILLHDPIGRLLDWIAVGPAQREVDLHLNGLASGTYVISAFGPQGILGSVRLFKP